MERVFNKEFSYLNFAAWYAQHEYVSLKVLEDPTLVKGNGEMSIALSAFVGLNYETVRFLLQAGADPKSRSNWRTRAVWRQEQQPSGWLSSLSPQCLSYTKIRGDSLMPIRSC